MPVYDDPRRQRAHDALHPLWTKAVGTPGYDKAQWEELDGAIYALGRDLKEAEKKEK